MPEAIDVLAPQIVGLVVVVLANSVETPSMIVEMVRGDTRPTLEFTAKDENGTIIPITGSTPRFRIRRKGRTAVLLTRTCTVTDGPNGKCQFVWQASDWNAGVLDAAGDYEGELEITLLDGTIASGFAFVEIFARDQVG